jgi:Family of unknown function (DUF6491)
MKSLSLRSVAALGAAALLAAACATKAPRAEEGESAYVVVEPNAAIFPAGNVHGFGVVDQDTLLLRVGANRLYLADVWPSCARDLRYEDHIAIDHRGSSTIDHFAQVVIGGRPCPLDNLRRVERKPAETGASAAEAPANGAPAQHY